jgi:drug/metabolite transporter (DMT)-like permease
MRRPARISGVAVAGVTAVISGFSVFINSYGVHAIHQPAVYTTAKNLVAAAALVLWAMMTGLREPRPQPLSDPPPNRPGRWQNSLALAYVAVVGGGVAFIFFFDGLAEMSAVPAAFLHDTLVVWVAILAVPILRERLSGWNVIAVAVLIVGQCTAGGGIGHLVGSRGELLVLAATVMWSIEVVVARRLLFTVAPPTLAVVRMGGGASVLLVYLSLSGRLSALINLTPHQVSWALLTGIALAGYVATWMVALARARAVDVTSVLVGGAVITAVLNALAGHNPTGTAAIGLALIAGGSALAIRAWPREPVTT